MSLLQAIQLLKFVKGITRVYTKWNMPDHAKPLWKWLIQCNEGGTPFNCTLGRYNPDYLKMYPHVPKIFFYVYFLGWSWNTNNKKNLTGTGAG